MTQSPHPAAPAQSSASADGPATDGRSAGSELATRRRNDPADGGRPAGPLSTEAGRITVAEGVVQKVAGMACREVSGVYAMGSGTSRVFGAIRERIPGSNGPSVSQGVDVEVGESEAAVDVDIVVEYGARIADVGAAIQRNVKLAVESMTGLRVVEVNVTVDDVHLPEDGDDKPAAESRVQ